MILFLHKNLKSPLKGFLCFRGCFPKVLHKDNILFATEDFNKKMIFILTLDFLGSVLKSDGDDGFHELLVDGLYA